MRTAAEYAKMKSNYHYLSQELEHRNAVVAELERQADLGMDVASVLQRERGAMLLCAMGIGNIEPQLPNDTILARFGIEAHEDVKERWHITAKTKVFDVDDTRKQWYYEIPGKTYLWDAQAIPVYTAVRGVVDMQAWARSRNDPGVLIGYAPEIDTLYVYEFKEKTK